MTDPGRVRTGDWFQKPQAGAAPAAIIAAMKAGILGPLLATALVGGLAVGAPAAGDDDAARLMPRPDGNVLLIVMDDMRIDDMDWMPRVQRRIFEAGTRFGNFYSPTALCCPTRASILRGQYPHNTGILTNAQPDGGWVGSKAIEDSTLATWLDPTYETGYVGKYFNGYEGRHQTEVPPGWDDWMGTIDTYGYMGIETNNNGQFEDNSGTNSPRLFAQQTQEFIRDQAGSTEPFFMHLSFVTPHNGGPHNDGDGGLDTPYVPPRDRDTYTGPPHARNRSYDERNVSDKVGPSSSLPRLSAQEEDDIALKMQQRRESLASADRSIGRILDTLRNQGKMRSTHIIFMSDNGYLLGEHRVPDSKRQPYELSSRLPLAIRGPGIPADSRRVAPAGTQDIAPTILDVAGAKADYPLDGRSLLPSAWDLDGNDNRRAIVLEGAKVPIDAENGGKIRYAPPRTIAETEWRYRGLVTRRWKLIYWDRPGDYELYDLRTDPHEVRSLYRRPGYVRRSNRMVARLDRLWMCQAATCE